MHNKQYYYFLEPAMQSNQKCMNYLHNGISDVQMVLGNILCLPIGPAHLRNENRQVVVCPSFQADAEASTSLPLNLDGS